ncbi:MAG: hypothetical protein CVV11_19785 [Gammaproteobacteria bacterium HGW-Gammaproteobacteria-15]|nr:MAG: hypothetical protein CVV11_19785 [Gammaproteobacteria bacterium HGW-Gammaproteobacteria-15]
MPLNLAGRSRALNAANRMGIWSTNPGLGATPAAGELADAPYERKPAVFNEAVDVAGVAECQLNANVPVDLHLTNPQNCQFLALFEDDVYLGYIVPSSPRNFTEPATVRQFVAVATTTKITASNAV